MIETNLAMQVLVSLLMWEVIKLAVARFFKKSVDTEYITAAQFQAHLVDCRSKSKADDRSVRDALAEVRGIIMVIALKVGIDEKEIVKLVKK